MPEDEFFEGPPTDQSLVKMTIVEKYFGVWARIMASTVPKIAYFDLFAGPGKYADGTSSTPLRVLETVIQDDQLAQCLVSIFNDKSERHCTALRESIANLGGIDRLKYRP